MLKSPTVSVWCLMYDLSFRVFLLHIRVPLYLGHRCSVLKFLLDRFFPVTNMKLPSLSVLIDFSMKSILLDIGVAIPAYFLGAFDWYNFSTLYSETMTIFESEMCFLYAEEG